MLVLIWLVVFALMGFSLVNTIPVPTPDRISRSKSSPEEVKEQSVIAEASGINLPTSRLPNWYHEATSDCIHAATKLCNTTAGGSDKPSAPSILTRHSNSVLGEAEVTGRIHSPGFPKPDVRDSKTSDCLTSLSSDVASAATIVQTATTPLPSGDFLYRAIYWSRIAFRGEVPRSNGLLLHKRQCHPVCANAEYSFCCELGQFCATSKGIPYRGTTISSAAQTLPSTSSTPTDVTPTSSSQTTVSSSATTGTSSTAQELPITSSTLSSSVTTTTTSASLTNSSTSQSSSTASDTQSSSTESSSSSASLLSSSAPSSPGSGGGGLSTSDKIALGIGIGIGIPALVVAIPPCIKAIRKL